jgi:epoxyqueuosine reductase
LNYDPDRVAPKLVDLMTLDDVAFRARFKGTPILRTRRRGLLRNVAVALGNWGSEEALPMLEQALGDQEPLIREHAAWAIERIRVK